MLALDKCMPNAYFEKVGVVSMNCMYAGKYILYNVVRVGMSVKECGVSKALV